MLGNGVPGPHMMRGLKAGKFLLNALRYIAMQQMDPVRPQFGMTNQLNSTI